jgi:LDH2 family malate/lactate/ureidoglycolate dehydrogenase
MQQTRQAEEGMVRVQPDELRRFVSSLLTTVGMAAEYADQAADTLVTADLRGVPTHGVSSMLRGYIHGMRRGWINATPEMSVVSERASAATIDCDRGLGVSLAPRAMVMAIEKARATGVGVITMRNAYHLGMAAYHALIACRQDMIGICMTATPPAVVPPNGSELRLGTNPIAVAVPAGRMHPFVFDAATSVVAASRLQAPKRTGASIPGNWLADAEGRVIREPGPVPEEYKLLPLGGSPEMGSHKGFALGMIVEIMCSLLAGALPAGMDRRSPFNHFVAAYDIAAFTDVQVFKQRMDEWLAAMEETPPAPGCDPVRTPGQGSTEAEADNIDKGVPLRPDVLEWFEEIRAELGVSLAVPAPITRP